MTIEKNDLEDMTLLDLPPGQEDQSGDQRQLSANWFDRLILVPIFYTDFLQNPIFLQNQCVRPAENQGGSACIVTVTGITVSHQAFSNLVNSKKKYDILQRDPGRLHTSHMFVSTTHMYIVFHHPIPFFL